MLPNYEIIEAPLAPQGGSEPKNVNSVIYNFLKPRRVEKGVSGWHPFLW